MHNIFTAPSSYNSYLPFRHILHLFLSADTILNLSLTSPLLPNSSTYLSCPISYVYHLMVGSLPLLPTSFLMNILHAMRILYVSLYLKLVPPQTSFSAHITLPSILGKSSYFQSFSTNFIQITISFLPFFPSFLQPRSILTATPATVLL